MQALSTLASAARLVPGFLVVDFDGTCTVKETIGLLPRLAAHLGQESEAAAKLARFKELEEEYIAGIRRVNARHDLDGPPPASLDLVGLERSHTHLARPLCLPALHPFLTLGARSVRPSNALDVCVHTPGALPRGARRPLDRGDEPRGRERRAGRHLSLRRRAGARRVGGQPSRAADRRAAPRLRKHSRLGLRGREPARGPVDQLVSAADPRDPLPPRRSARALVQRVAAGRVDRASRPRRCRQARENRCPRRRGVREASRVRGRLSDRPACDARG
mmetsp:Transcript_37044/g.110725  ORF Transcript_37044/g.110725 Transcript_37044/m.110725 type:complete len:276 (+) Transcript_37044:1-828(+)